MEIRISSKTVLQILNIISFLIFVGLTVEACGFFFNTIYTVAINPVGAQHFWKQLNVAPLYDFDPVWFTIMMFFVVVVGVLKVLMFWGIVRILTYQKLDMTKPFSKEMGRFVSGLAYFSLAIGFFSSWAVKEAAWIASQGVVMPTNAELSIDGADGSFFMGIVLLVIASIFKRGIELQSENELTI